MKFKHANMHKIIVNFLQDIGFAHLVYLFISVFFPVFEVRNSELAVPSKTHVYAYKIYKL